MDVNAIGKVVAQSVSGKVPVIGGLLSGLIGLFWPTSGPDIWDEIKAKVEALVSQDISENNLNELKLTLQGLKDDLNDYLILTSKDEKKEKLIAIDTVIVSNVPRFLNGDPDKGFSCFWGMALLHISVRHDLVQLFGGADNQTLYEESVKAYCCFGNVALPSIFNDRMRQVVVLCSSANQPGKASRWIIDVSMVDDKDNHSIYTYNKFYTNNQWTQQIFDQDTRECNAGLGSVWDTMTSQLRLNLKNLAGDAIDTMKSKYPVSSDEGLVLLQKIMDNQEYDDFKNKYIPSSKNVPGKPAVELNTL